MHAARARDARVHRGSEHRLLPVTLRACDSERTKREAPRDRRGLRLLPRLRRVLLFLLLRLQLLKLRLPKLVLQLLLLPDPCTDMRKYGKQSAPAPLVIKLCIHLLLPRGGDLPPPLLHRQRAGPLLRLHLWLL